MFFFFAFYFSLIAFSPFFFIFLPSQFFFPFLFSFSSITFGLPLLPLLLIAQGCIFEIHIFAPRPFLIYIFSPNEIWYKEGVRAAGELGELFRLCLCYFVNLLSIGEKICILFTNWGKNRHFPPFFHSLSIIFSPTCYLAGGGGGQTEKNTPL